MKLKGLLHVTFAYVVTLSVLWAALQVLGKSPIWDMFWAGIAATIGIFVFSRLYNNSSFYDAYWSVIPPLIALYWMLKATASGINVTRAWLVVIIVWLWGIRLTANWLDYVAAVATAIVILIGLVSDIQLYSFINGRKEGEILKTGLWARSRHPDYSGQWVFWAGLALFGVAGVPEAWWWVLPGAVAMLAMFLLASIPMIDKRSMERPAAYAEHTTQVSGFLPWFPKKSD